MTQRRQLAQVLQELESLNQVVAELLSTATPETLFLLRRAHQQVLKAKVQLAEAMANQAPRSQTFRSRP